MTDRRADSSRRDRFEKFARGRVAGRFRNMAAYARACVESSSGKPPQWRVVTAVAKQLPHERREPLLPRWRVVTAVALVFALTLAPVAALTSTAAVSAAPSGMVGVPSSNVGFPDQASNGGDRVGERIPADAAAWGIMTDAHASDLRASIDRGADGSLRVTLTDDVNHEGRRVAVDAATLADSHGSRPAFAFGAHSSGSTWRAPIEYQDGAAVFDVPRFSTNTVTFDGTVSLSGNPASDGTTYSYDVDNLDAVGDFSANLTGHVSEAWANESGSDSPGDTSNISVGGTLDPEGPSAANAPVIEVTAGEMVTPFEVGDVVDDFWGKNSAGTLYDSEARIDNPPSKISHVRVDVTSDDYDGTVDVYLVEGEEPDGVYGEGTLVKSGYSPTGEPSQTIELDTTITTSSTTVTVEFVSSGGTAGTKSRIEATEKNGTWGSDNGATDSEARHVYVGSAPPKNLNVSADDGAGATMGNFTSGESKTAELPVSTAATNISWTGSGGFFDWTLQKRERTESVDPTIEVNGNSVGHSGTLADGTTTTLTVNESWIQEGTNRVNVTLTSPASGPTGAVGLDYSHNAESNQSVEYEGEQWSERYNVSKTYASDRTDATLTIPFAGNVVDIRNVELRVNGGEWESPQSYQMFNTTLTVDLPDVSANDTVDVRSTGSKVVVSNGRIQVTYPTAEGNTLNTTFEITDYSDGFEIDVSGTSEGNYVHYLTEESWTSPDAYARVSSGGGQLLRAPNAATGSTARARSLPLEARPDNDVDVRVQSAGSEPRFKVSPGGVSGDSVEYVWHDTTSGETYELWSVTRSIVIDKDTAESPVYFLASGDDSETLEIRLVEAVLGSSDGGGGGGAMLASSSTNPLASPYLLMIIGAALLLGVSYVARSRGVPVWTVGAIVALVALVTVESLAPGTLSGALAETVAGVGGGLARVSAAIWLSGAAIVLWALYRVVKSRTRKTDVNLKLDN